MPSTRVPGFHVYGQLPAGCYYIGDLGYIFPDEEWFDAYDNMHVREGDVRVGIFVSSQNVPYANFKTMHGDGQYEGSYHDEMDDEDFLYYYHVDSASIGCYPYDDDKDNPFGREDEKTELGEFHYFNEPFDVSYDTTTGIIRFGYLEIRTAEMVFFTDADSDTPFEERVSPFC